MLKKKNFFLQFLLISHFTNGFLHLHFHFLNGLHTLTILSDKSFLLFGTFYIIIIDIMVEITILVDSANI